MGYLAEKYNYIKGLYDGLEMNEPETKEGKLLAAMMDFLDEVAFSIDVLEDSVDDLAESMDDLEEMMDECCCDCDDCDCGCCGDDEDYINEVECPECKGVFVLTEDLFSDDSDYIACPLCNEKIELDWSDVEEIECDCESPDCDCNE